MAGIIENARDVTNQLGLPFLTFLGAASLVIGDNPVNVKTGGMLLAGLAMNTSLNIAWPDAYRTALSAIGTNAKAISGVLGLATCGVLGIPALQTVLDAGTIAHPASFSVLANAAPWLIASGADFLESVTGKNYISNRTHALLCATGGVCVASFGCMAESSSSLFTGIMFTMEGIGRAATSAAVTAPQMKDLPPAAERDSAPTIP